MLFAGLLWLGVYDLRQTKRSVLRNYPIIGHIRYMLEYVRPEIRQYFIESDAEATPFSRSQRSLVYQRAKGDPDKRPFATELIQAIVQKSQHIIGTMAVAGTQPEIGYHAYICNKSHQRMVRIEPRFAGIWPFVSLV